MALKGFTRNSAVFLSLTVALTLLFYLLAYYFLTGFEATPKVMLLFAAIAGVLVWLSQIIFCKTRSGHDGPVVLLIFASSLAAALLYTATANALTPIQPAEGNGSSDSQGRSTVCQLNSGPRAGTTYRLTTSLRVGARCEDGAGSAGVVVAEHNLEGNFLNDHTARTYKDSMSPSSAPNSGNARPAKSHSAETESAIDADSAHADIPSPGHTTFMRRVTGTAFLLGSQTEESGYGLYSYALLTRPPQESELPKYRAFVKALVKLQRVSDLRKYLPRARINITYLPVTSIPSARKQSSLDQQTDYIISHYDYARAAAILASMPQQAGSGPVIVSVLTPVRVDRNPHPVLVMDLTTAQPALMTAYVQLFCDKAAQDHFWNARTLEEFGVKLNNLLVTAATGLGMSATAVKYWQHFYK